MNSCYNDKFFHEKWGAPLLTALHPIFNYQRKQHCGNFMGFTKHCKVKDNNHKEVLSESTSRPPLKLEM